MLNSNYQPYLESLDKLGFCSFSVFEAEEIDKLSLLYQANFGEKAIAEMYASHNSNPVALSLQISSEIKKIVADKLSTVFNGYEFFIGHFMVKGAMNEKEFSLHQDWNIVDESKYKSYQVWIPLDITYPANGGMFVVPGSHRFFGNHRSGSYGIPVVRSDEKTDSIITDVIIPAGDVLVYHNGLFHGSYPNTTSRARIAVIVNFVQKEAPTYYFHHNKEQKRTDLYKIDGETLLCNLPQLEKGIIHPDIPYVGSLPENLIENFSIDSDELAKAYRELVGSVDGAQIKQLPILHHKGIESELHEKGYTVVDLLSEQAIELFRNEYKFRFGRIDRSPGRFTTLQDTNSQIKKEVHEFIVANIEEALATYFSDFVIPVSQFYTKKAHTSGDIDLHADSTLLLNHQLEPHYAIWIPLVDVDEKNGTLTVVPYSHKVKGAFFGAAIGGGYHHEHMDWLRGTEVPLRLKAGQAVIFDNNLLHNSTANITDEDRLCFTFRITHKQSRYYSFFSEDPKKNEFSVFQEKQDYYMTENWDGDNKRPTGRYAGTLKNSITQIDKENLKKILKLSQMHG